MTISYDSPSPHTPQLAAGSFILCCVAGGTFVDGIVVVEALSYSLSFFI
jgi:hypothetical protein